jgi:hypothetical protein
MATMSGSGIVALSGGRSEEVEQPQGSHITYKIQIKTYVCKPLKV